MTQLVERQSRRRRQRKRNGFLIALAVVAATLVLAVLSLVGYVLAIASSGPELSELKPVDKGETSVIFDSEGHRLGYVQSDEIRTPVPWSAMPEHLRDAVVAIEDERFYEHKGVDYSAIIRAGVKNLESGKNVQGGSTITQQLVRALYIKDPERNFKRKIREAKLASELENEHSKEWILKNYLNDVPFGTVEGRTAIGIEAAAETFFDKHTKELSLAQAAMLAGLPQAPSQYNPFRNSSAALVRRREVLQQMAENRMISRAEARRAAAEPLGVRRGRRYTARREPFFFDYVQEALIEEYGVGVYRRGGLKVHTTIDPQLQDAARQAIQGRLPNPSDPSAAIVSVDPSTGYIRAMASSGTYRDRRFNLAAQGHRQPGSAFKTFVLTAAVRAGVNPAAKSYTSRPLNLTTPYGPWQVKTYGNTYGGTMNLVRATLSSDNTVYAQLILDLGPKKVRETARLMGITTKLDALPAEGLGGLRLGVSPLEMANAYATLASGGIRNEAKGIRKVVFPDGKSDDLGEPERKRVFSDGVAYEVTKILKQNVTSGTGTRANIGCPVAGKTGTTDKFNDAWFVGYTPELATSTWVGFPNAQRSMPGVAGGTIPAGIWHDYMAVAKGRYCGDFPQPKEAAKWAPFPGRRQSSAGGQGSGGYYNQQPAPNDGGGGGYGGGDTYGGGADDSGGGGNYYRPAPTAPPPVSAPNYNRGYAPRPYDDGPQGAPAPVAPAPRVPSVPEGDPDEGAADPQP